ncbi:MAG: SLBB domain-containing protein [Akkermansiaceae bacterium]
MKQHLAIAVVLAFLHPANSCEPSSPPQNSPKTKTIRVRIYGEINQPQILDLPRGSTLRDAIKAGDGVTPGGANRRIKVFQNKSVKSYDLTKEAGPILAEDAYVSVPFLTSTSLAESTAKESVDISATKPVPLEDLKILLQRKVKGE